MIEIPADVRTCQHSLSFCYALHFVLIDQSCIVFCEDSFNDDFWLSLDGICNALDNMEARPTNASEAVQCCSMLQQVKKTEEK